MLVLKAVTSSWRRSETIWADSVKESWLQHYLDGTDCVVIRRADKLSDSFSERLKGWKHRNFVFVAEKVHSAAFNRRMGRLGKRKECSAASKGREEAVRIMCEQIGVKLSDRAASRLTVTDAYWTLEKARMLGIKPEVLLERQSSAMMALVDWNERVMDMTPDEVAWRAGCVMAVARLMKDGESKWRVVQEAIRLAPGEVSAAYVAGSKLVEDERKIEALVARMELLSEAAEETEPVMPYVYLVGRRI